MTHKDKRSVHTDALETLGTVIGDSEKRDAIHLAVEPVEAGEWLVPGQHISLVNGKAFNRTGHHIGIVDPFLNSPIAPGQKFWLVVYPRMITSLRHVWTHPMFPDVPEVAEVAVEPVPFAKPAETVKKASRRKSSVKVTEALKQAALEVAEEAASIRQEQQKAEAEKWLRDYADQMDADFEEMMYVAKTHYDASVHGTGYGDYLCEGGKWESETTPPEFWDHYVVFKDVEPIPEDKWKPSFFSCSC